MNEEKYTIPSIRSYKCVTAYKQIRRCVMKFCQTGKISTRICVFDDAETLQTGHDSNSNSNKTQLHELSGC